MMLDRTKYGCPCCGQQVTLDVILAAPKKLRNGLLSPLERKILQLVREGPEGLSRKELYEKVMPDNMGGTHALGIAILMLNRKLRSAGYEIWVGCVPGAKYKLREYRG